MNPTEPDKLVLNYAPPEAEDAVPSLEAMERWRSICGRCLLGAILTSFVWHAAGLGLFAAAVVTGFVALFYMTRAAKVEMGWGYAIGHLCLALFLSLFFLLGVWAVPALVRSDLIKWQAKEERAEAQGDEAPPTK